MTSLQRRRKETSPAVSQRESFDTAVLTVAAASPVRMGLFWARRVRDIVICRISEFPPKDWSDLALPGDAVMLMVIDPGWEFGSHPTPPAAI